MNLLGITSAGRGNYKPLSKCSMEELAIWQQTAGVSGGIAFARNVDGEQKSAARQMILDLFHPDQWGERHLSILTMPGLLWRFERKLLAMREPGWTKRAKAKTTSLCGVENDRLIFYSGCMEMPGVQNPDALLWYAKPRPFAERLIKTRFGAFYFANIDDLMTYDWSQTTNHNVFGWDAVWLDYTGPLTRERLALIRHFYERFVREILVVTALKARWNRETSSAIDRNGGHSQWLRKYLVGEALHDIEYFDTSPMAQFAIRKHPALSKAEAA